MEAENHHAHGASAGKGCDFAEIEVKGENDSALGNGLREDLAVREPVKTLFTEMNGVVALFTKPRDDANVHPHIHKESHRFPRVYLPTWTCS